MIALTFAAVLLQTLSPAGGQVDSLLTAGRQHLVGAVVGRYAALDAFRRAARLAPRDPEPLYWQMKTGFYLGSDEGDVIAREAILRILTLEPSYADVWDRFHDVYQNRATWRRAERALAAHPDNVAALRARAELAIALEQPQRADSLLEVVLRLSGPEVSDYLLRAEAEFLARHDSAGYRWYGAALEHAAADSTGALWDRVWMIATPTEATDEHALAPDERAAFFARFWTRRDPNLLTAANERIAEHFRRFAYARRHFRLLHPQNMYHRSAVYRTLLLSYERGFADQIALHPGEPYAGADHDRRFAPGEGTASAVSGFDARGLIYLRHGPPDELRRGAFDPLSPLEYRGSSLDVEGWVYRSADTTLTIGFKRGTSMGAGDFVFMPSNRRQAASTKFALRTDRSTLPAPLEPRIWSAFFQNVELGLTDVYYRTSGDSAAAVLWDTGGKNDPVRVRGASAELLQLTVPPGTYALGLDVDSAGVLGRLRREIDVPAFSTVDLELSSLVVAPSTTLLDRETTLQRMPANLVYAAGTPLATYVEIYGLTTNRAGRSQYQLRYSFTPVRSFPARLFRDSRPIAFEFTREGDSRRAVEQLIIEPDRIPRGRYRVTVAVTDLSRNVKSESVALEIEIR
jgi:GWxTD domain-containing protein